MNEDQTRFVIWAIVGLCALCATSGFVRGKGALPKLLAFVIDVLVLFGLYLMLGV